MPNALLLWQVANFLPSTTRTSDPQLSPILSVNCADNEPWRCITQGTLPFFIVFFYFTREKSTQKLGLRFSVQLCCQAHRNPPFASHVPDGETSLTQLAVSEPDALLMACQVRSQINAKGSQNLPLTIFGWLD